MDLLTKKIKKFNRELEKKTYYIKNYINIVKNRRNNDYPNWKNLENNKILNDNKIRIGYQADLTKIKNFKPNLKIEKYKIYDKFINNNLSNIKIIKIFKSDFLINFKNHN